MIEGALSTPTRFSISASMGAYVLFCLRRIVYCAHLSFFNLDRSTNFFIDLEFRRTNEPDPFKCNANFPAPVVGVSPISRSTL